MGRQAKLTISTLGAWAAAVTGATASPPLAVIDDGPGAQPAMLTTIDTRTLMPTGSPLLEIAEPHGRPSLAPDGQSLALGLSATNPVGPGRVGMQLFDLRSRVVTHSIATAIASEAVEWFTPTRVAALTQSGHVIVVDTGTGAILRRKFVGEPGCTYQSARLRDRAVFLLGRRGRTARLAVANADGRIAAVSLPRVRFGTTGSQCQSQPMAVQSGSAFVVAGGTNTVTEVALSTLRVTHHAVPRQPGTVTREIQEIGWGRVAIAGADATGPAGVKVAETAAWTMRGLDRHASGVRRLGGLILTYSGAADRRPRGARDGVSAFGALDLRRRWRARTGVPVWNVQAAAGALFARTDSRVFVLDPATGATLARPAYSRLARLDLIS